MKLILENWKKFLNESKDKLLDLRNQEFKNCWQVNSFLTNNHSQESDLECIGVGTDKMVFIDKNKPGYVLKIEKKNSVKENSTMEEVVWKYLKDTPFSRILAPIESKDKFYYMLFSETSGSLDELEKELFSISEQTGFKFKELEYYFLADANRNNIRKINDKTVLIDYDDVWPWVFKNKQKIAEIK